MNKGIFIDTCYGEVLAEESIDDGVLECYIGNNYDEYIGYIDGTVYDDTQTLIDRIEKLF